MDTSKYHTSKYGCTTKFSGYTVFLNLSLCSIAPEPVLTIKILFTGLDDVSAVSNAVDQRFAEPGVGYDSVPLREWQVGGEDHSCPFRSFRDDLEEELRPDFCQRHVAHFVDGDQLITAPSCHHPPQLQLMLGFHQLVDQRGGP